MTGLAFPDVDGFGRGSNLDGCGWIPSNPAGGSFAVFHSLYGHFDPEMESANPVNDPPARFRCPVSTQGLIRDVREQMNHVLTQKIEVGRCWLTL
jgi:hypothetical protein